MAKRLILTFVAVCLICCTLVACGEPAITAQEAYQVVLNDLGDSAANAQSPHVHEGEYNGKDCYTIYITVGEENLVYSVSFSGEILNKAHGSSGHAH